MKRDLGDMASHWLEFDPEVATRLACTVPQEKEQGPDLDADEFHPGGHRMLEES